jgi:tetratricopeptide (TPR) repeat protein
MEELTRRGGMAGETFQSSRYWTRTRNEPPSPERLERFEAYITEATNRSKRKLDSHPDDIEALYFLGATEGVQSAFEATIKRRYFAAYRAGRRGRKWHNKLIELAPSFADAYLVPGIYEYATASLKRSVKVLAFLIGIRGSKDKGRHYIRKAAEGNRAYWGARLSLVVLDTREKRYDKALAHLRELESSFPRNPLFTFEKGWVYLLKKDWPAARSIYNDVRNKQQLQSPNFDRIPSSVIALRLGESFLFDAKFTEAIRHFDDGLGSADLSDTVRSLLHLRKGQAYDGLDRRQEAMTEYQATVRLNADKASRRLAKRYLKKPFSLNPDKR